MTNPHGAPHGPGAKLLGSLCAYWRRPALSRAWGAGRRVRGGGPGGARAGAAFGGRCADARAGPYRPQATYAREKGRKR